VKKSEGKEEVRTKYNEKTHTPPEKKKITQRGGRLARTERTAGLEGCPLLSAPHIRRRN
jgi:hypothetical protein